jgi:hypothetical protein
MGDRLYASQVMYQNSYLVSRNRNYVAWMQPDSNFVVYKLSQKSDTSRDNCGYEAKAIFATNTITSSKSFLMFQLDGNLVIYSDVGRETNLGQWSSGVPGGRYRFRMCATAKCQLVLQDDGNLVAFKTIPSASSKKMEDVAYWSTINLPPQSNFDSVTSSSLAPSCPLPGPQRHFTYNLLLQSNGPPSPADHVYGPDQSDTLTRQNGLWNKFIDHEAKNPKWMTDMNQTMYQQKNLTNWNLRTGQKAHYHKSSDGSAHYVCSVVRPHDIRKDRDIASTDDQMRDYTNKLVAAAGINDGSSNNQFASFDAGHLLPPNFGNSISGSPTIKIMTFNTSI